MQLGWIKLQRSITEHWLHEDKPFNRFGAWIDLLLMANHDARKLPTRTGVLTIERGQMLTSTRSLASPM